MNYKINSEIEKSISILKKNGIILYPTDTIWGIGGDATNSLVVEKIYKIKNRNETKSMIILVDSLEMLRKYVSKIPLIALSLIEETKKPTTIIYPKAQHLPQNLISEDGTVAIRIVKHHFCKKIISIFNKPIISTSANISGENTPSNFSEISNKIKEKVDYIVDLEKENFELRQSSKIIKIVNETKFETIRE